jgi:propionyl-CoA synthetase
VRSIALRCYTINKGWSDGERIDSIIKVPPSKCYKSTTLSSPPPPSSSFSSSFVSSMQRRYVSHSIVKNQSPPRLGPDALDLTTVRGKFGSYQNEYNRSIESPEDFWLEQATASLVWYEEPQIAFQKDPTNSYLHDWFPDGMINTCYNCLDVHVEENGRGDQIALLYDSPLTGKKEQYTYRELLDHVSRFAGVLQNELGVQVGDRVIIYMPLIPQSAIAMLACARIGAIHSVVFGGFAAPELANRISDCTPKVVITASCGVEPTRIVQYQPIVQDALKLSNHGVDSVVVVQRPDVQDSHPLGPSEVDYDELMTRPTSMAVPAIPLPSTHPHYILYTSGTTGLPKGMVRDTGGYATALKYSMNHFYNLDPGDVVWAASDIGWVVGHSYLVYAPLLHGCTSVMYEGKPVGTPDASAFWRVIAENHVKVLFTAPTAFRVMKQADPDAQLIKQYNVQSLESIFVGGEHCDPETIHWLERAIPHISPPVDHWWQTELGWPAVGNSVGLGRLPVRYGSCSMPVPGYQISILDDTDGQPVGPNELGNMVIKTPLPPGTLKTIYKDDDRYIKTYLSKYDGYYDTGDAAYRDTDGYIYIMGRTDDVINTAGHRLSTGMMEEILLEHPKVADCAVIPVVDVVKGQLPFGFVVCNKDTTEIEHDQICADLVNMVRESLGPVAAFKNVAVVKGLPKTRSGKILRGTMSKIANGLPYKVTPTIEDASIFDHISQVIVDLVRNKKT